MFPLVDRYLRMHQIIGKAFVDESIELFEKKFPKSNIDYSALLKRVTIYSVAEKPMERQDYLNAIAEKFQLSNVNAYSPILDQSSLETY